MQQVTIYKPLLTPVATPAEDDLDEKPVAPTADEIVVVGDGWTRRCRENPFPLRLACDLSNIESQGPRPAQLRLFTSIIRVMKGI